MINGELTYRTIYLSEGFDMIRLLTIGAAFFALAACTADPISSLDFPESRWSQNDGYDDRYLLAPGDTIEVSVLYAPELSRTVVVAPDGRVRIPYSGPIAATGRTVDEVRLSFNKALGRELKNPEVEVIATEFASQRIFIGGEVQAPSIYDLPGQIGPLQAIVMAGGFTDEARQNAVVLMRRLPGGEIRSEVLDIRAGVFDAQLAEWGPLRRFDIVYVPKSKIAEENLFMLQWFRAALPVEFRAFYDVRNDPSFE